MWSKQRVQSVDIDLVGTDCHIDNGPMEAHFHLSPERAFRYHQFYIRAHWHRWIFWVYAQICLVLFPPRQYVSNLDLVMTIELTLIFKTLSTAPPGRDIA